MPDKIWIFVMFGNVIYWHTSAQFCVRRYVDSKWISKGDCKGPKRMSEIMKEAQDKADDENKWIVFQRRVNGSVDFYRGWDEYVMGFGNHDSNFWLGLEEMHQRTNKGDFELQINMITSSGVNLVAKCSNFRVGPGSDYYKLTVSGYSGNATDQITHHNSLPFTTKDEDHDKYEDGNCATRFKGAWWYHWCAVSNLNGYFNETGDKRIWWGHDRKIMNYTEMKFRRKI